MTTQLTRLVCWVCGGAAILGGDVSVQETLRQDPANVLGGLMDESVSNWQQAVWMSRG